MIIEPERFSSRCPYLLSRLFDCNTTPMDGKGVATLELKPRLAIGAQICLALKKHQARINIKKEYIFHIAS